MTAGRTDRAADRGCAILQHGVVGQQPADLAGSGRASLAKGRPVAADGRGTTTRPRRRRRWQRPASRRPAPRRSGPACVALASGGAAVAGGRSDGAAGPVCFLGQPGIAIGFEVSGVIGDSRVRPVELVGQSGRRGGRRGSGQLRASRSWGEYPPSRPRRRSHVAVASTASTCSCTFARACHEQGRSCQPPAPVLRRERADLRKRQSRAPASRVILEVLTLQSHTAVLRGDRTT